MATVPNKDGFGPTDPHIPNPRPRIVVLTQAEYDALAVKQSDVVYMILA